MGSEVFLYGYGLVCLSMLVFNLIYSLHLRASDRRLRRQVQRIAAPGRGSRWTGIRQASAGGDAAHQLSHARARLSRVNDLLAFDRLFG